MSEWTRFVTLGEYEVNLDMIVCVGPASTGWVVSNGKAARTCVTLVDKVELYLRERPESVIATIKAAADEPDAIAEDAAFRNEWEVDEAIDVDALTARKEAIDRLAESLDLPASLLSPFSRWQAHQARVWDRFIADTNERDRAISAQVNERLLGVGVPIPPEVNPVTLQRRESAPESIEGKQLEYVVDRLQRDIDNNQSYPEAEHRLIEWLHLFLAGYLTWTNEGEATR